MNFQRKMINRRYDIKLDMPYEEFGKRPIVSTNMRVRKKPKDVFVIKFNDCTKVYAVSDKSRPCSECPMHINYQGKGGCGLYRRVAEYDITVCACSYVGSRKGMSNIGFVDMDTLLEGL